MADGAALDDRLGLYYDTLLDSLADGVLSISPDRRVEVLNATGAAILGADPDAVIGRTLIEAFLNDAANDDFVDAILAAVGGDGGTAKTVVGFSRAGVPCRLAVASTSYRVPSGPQTGRLGVVVTFNDVTEVLRLRGAEEALQRDVAAEHAKLQAAYVKLEEAAERERRIGRRTRVVRWAAAIGVFVLFSGVALYNWRSAGFAGSSNGPAEADSETLTVTTRPVTSRVSVVGAVDAGSVVSVVGPFDGLVRQKQFDYGGPVERGQPLVTVDIADTQIRLRDAEGVEIKARQRLDELRNWTTGPDVSRARRALASADLENSSLRSRLAQTKMLLSKGIVAADEYTQLVQQQRNQDLQLQAARQDLDATIERGNEENRRIAEFELLNAQAKAQELRLDLTHAQVLAPVSGVVLQPPDTEGKRSETIAVGSRITRGQTMFAIGDLETFSVRAKVDEIDINKIRAGQKAIVTGDAFDDMSLEGTVTSVAAQASGESATRSGMATFPITVQIASLTPEQRARVHVGMSASLSIVAYDNPEAIVVPPGAVRDEDGKRVVRVQRGGGMDSVAVTLGISTPDGVEIRRGLNAGDVVSVAK